MKKALAAFVLVAFGAVCVAFQNGNNFSLPAVMAIGQVINWNSDTGISRSSRGAGYVALGNGAAADKSGFAEMRGWVIAEGTTPTTAASAGVCWVSASHQLACSMSNAPAHPLPQQELGTCTMVAGTCTFTPTNGFNNSTGCNAIWTGTGTLTGILRVTEGASNCVVTSSVGTDTAQVRVTMTALLN